MIKKKPLIAAGMLSLALLTQAVPAKRGAITTITQPDGTTLTIELHGDEYNHYTTTLDGALVTSDAEGWYSYGRLGAGGVIENTGIHASDQMNRTAEERRLVASISSSTESLAERRMQRQRPMRNRAASSRANAPINPGLFPSSFQARGEMRSIVILVEFSNKKFTTPNPNDYFTRQMNERGFSETNGTGSVRDYFLDNSYGVFSPTFDVYGPVTLSQQYSYYGKNDRWGDDIRPHEAVWEACRILCDEQGVDFSPYDFDNDGVVDNVYMIYAGEGESGFGGENTIWPHSADITYSDDNFDLQMGTKSIDHYACSSELTRASQFGKPYPEGIGTIVHEFSHVLGLPDLYNTNNSYADYTPGEWNIVDYGCYANDSRTPVGYSIYERYALGWLSPMAIGDRPADANLRPISSGDGALYSIGDGKEYFLFENRELTGWDKYLPADGMLIWHIDYDENVWDRNAVNNDPTRQRVDIIEADGTYGDSSYDGDPYPGSEDVTAVTLEPRAALGQPLAITDIARDGKNIRFKINGGGASAIELPDELVSESVFTDGLNLTVNNTLTGPGHLIVTDLTGRMILDCNIAPGRTTYTLPSAGLYIVRLGDSSQKIMVR